MGKRGPRRTTGLPGEVYGGLTILEEAEPTFGCDPRKPVRHVLCRCECGDTKVIGLGALRGGRSVSCGCAGRVTVTAGDIFGKLTVLTELEPIEYESGAKGRRVACLCECGERTTALLAHLRSGATTSCGCNARTHGHTRGGRSPTYICWMAMRARCANPKDPGFGYYGGRGITVCDRWRGSFENFLADMGERPEGLTLDRVDNSGNYEPGNCRWATWSEQNLNRRPWGTAKAA